MGGPGSGPIPKRSEERRNRGEPAYGSPISAPAGQAPKWPRAYGDWHPLAIAWYNSLKVSGQARFYEQSDVAVARAAAEVLSRAYMRNSATLMAVWSDLSTQLLTTEASRRRARIELQRGQPEAPPSQSKLLKYRLVAKAQP